MGLAVMLAYLAPNFSFVGVMCGLAMGICLQWVDVNYKWMDFGYARRYY